MSNITTKLPVGNKDCTLCHGDGYYQYSTKGTPHSKICENCCKHKREPWKAENGKYYCGSGCGKEITPKEQEK